MKWYNCLHPPVVQWIELRTSKPAMGVRFPPGGTNEMSDDRARCLRTVREGIERRSVVERARETARRCPGRAELVRREPRAITLGGRISDEVIST